jgi:hypothetical protein
MTPQEKAAALILKFSNLINYDFVSDLKFNNPNDEDRNRRVKKDAKKCAKIAVDEILQLVDEQMQGFLDTDIIAYWEQVKNEIEKL